jgi:hypothetical protein
MELGLTADEDAFVRATAVLYKAAYLDTLDNVFKVGHAIKILRDRFRGSGIKGGLGDALVQYGYTTRDGKAMDKAIRSNFTTLFDNEAAVRAWWAKVPEKKKRDWLSARAIHRHWTASLKPPDAPRKPSAFASETRPPGPAGHEAAALEARIRKLEAQLARERAAPPDDPASLPKSYRKRFEAMVRRQNREFEARVKHHAQQEARRVLDEISLPYWHKRLDEISSQLAGLDRLRPLMAQATRRLILACLHSDSRMNTSEKRLNEAFVAFNDKRIEIALCGKEAERPKMPSHADVPRTWTEMMANRAAYDAKNRARARRAAATRAAKAAAAKAGTEQP